MTCTTITEHAARELIDEFLHEVATTGDGTADALVGRLRDAGFTITEVRS